jgi:hypothetical protein
LWVVIRLFFQFFEKGKVVRGAVVLPTGACRSDLMTQKSCQTTEPDSHEGTGEEIAAKKPGNTHPEIGCLAVNATTATASHAVPQESLS